MNSAAQQSDLVKKMKGANVLVVGDVMLDRFVYGAVERISPESPVPVLAITRESMMLGGAGNTLSNIAHLDAKGSMIAIVGNDESGKSVRDLAEKLDIGCDGLIVVQDRPTSVKTRFLAGHQQLLRTDFERTDAVSGDIQDKIVEQVVKGLETASALILSDYGKGTLTPELTAQIIKRAQEKNVPVLVDPKGRDYSRYKGATAVTPNKKELSEASGGMPVETDEQVAMAARKVAQDAGIGAVIATRSKDGMSVVPASGEPIHIRSAADIEVFDVSGAGDSVIATIAAALASGADLVQAAGLANLAGSIVVAKVGTAPIRADELLEALAHHDIEGDIVKEGRPQASKAERMRAAPVFGWNEAKEEVQRWRARGLKVGFTNGCFDILHYGHVNYLNDARRKCDRLVVGLNRDASISILKGPERPVHDENSRAAVMAALGAVDMVVLFGAEKEGDDNTACALLDVLQPDIYFKGGDYTIDQIPEAPTVMKAGGIVDVMPVYEGHSTTSSIKKMQGKGKAA